jgi:hypothetical protein
VAVHVFFNPDLVGQLAACGITPRRQPTPGGQTRGFVLEGRRVAPRGRQAVTNVALVHENVTLSLPARSAPPAQLTLPAATAAEPQGALELAAECARLRRDNQRLAEEVARLRGDVARLSGAPPTREQQQLDDAATRFSLLELDL